MIASRMSYFARRSPAMVASGLFCVAAGTSTASAGIVTFENLNPSSVGSPNTVQLSQSVDGFSFTATGISANTPYGWRYFSPLSSWGSYYIGTRGTTAVYSAFNNSYSPNPAYLIRREAGGLWSFGDAVFTAAHAMGRIHLVGLRDGMEVFNFTQSISNTQETVVSLGSEPGAINWIDTLKITNDLASSSGSRAFIMDDMQYTLPAPGVLALVGIAGHGIRRRRCRN